MRMERQPAGLLIHFPVNSETNDTACQIPYHISRHQDCNYEVENHRVVVASGEDLRRKISKARPFSSGQEGASKSILSITLSGIALSLEAARYI